MDYQQQLQPQTLKISYSSEITQHQTLTFPTKDQGIMFPSTNLQTIELAYIF